METIAIPVSRHLMDASMWLRMFTRSQIDGIMYHHMIIVLQCETSFSVVENVSVAHYDKDC